MRRRSVAAVFVLLLLSPQAGAVPGLDSRPANPTCLAHPRPGIGSDVAIATQRMFPYLTLGTSNEFSLQSLMQSPMMLRQSPTQAGVWYLAERGGLVLRLDDTAQTSAPFLDIQSRVHADYLDQNEEGGLLGLALDPDFASNGELYVYYTGAPVPAGSAALSVLSRFRSLDGGMTVDPASEEILFTLPQASIHHHAGALEFGPDDGMLYVGVGDSGSPSEAQNKNSKLGAILRLDVHSGSPYAIPPDNPYASGGGAPEIWVKGLRNPYRFSFDPQNGELIAGDVGQTMWEEVDLIVRGGNYGWPIREGTACYADCCTNPGSPQCSTTGLIDPVYTYPHTGAACAAVIGGYVYRGNLFPELRGVYLFSDWCTTDVRRLFSSGDTVGADKIYQAAGLFRSFAQDAAGEVYLLRTRFVEKLVRSTGPPPAPFPKHLSETGSVNAADATQPAAGAIPYGVDAPLWSDGAVKHRWMGLPDGQQISVGADGDWTFPIGSVLMKRFELGGKPIETRLFMHHDDGGWAGYTYEWNAAGTDADLLDATGKTKEIGDQTWIYPSRDQCMSCHTETAGFTLGPMTGQLNGNFYYLSTGRMANQLDTLEHIGVLDSTPDHAQRITTQGSDSIDLLARSYLHANCAHCHAPGSPVQASIDLRFSTPLDQMHVCGAAPTQGDLGVAGARIIAPGDPSHSILSLRMHERGADQMPPIATNVVDPGGTTIVDAWIRALQAAPDGSCLPRPVPACSNGVDDDGDGLVDFPDDPGCADPGGMREDPACDNAVDDDGDGLVDFDGGVSANHGVAVGPPDPRCGEAYLKSEERGCGLGAELLLALALVARLQRRLAS